MLKTVAIFLVCFTVIGVLFNLHVPTVDNTELAFDNLQDESTTLVEDVGSFQVLYYTFQHVMLDGQPLNTDIVLYDTSYYLDLTYYDSDGYIQHLSSVYLSTDFEEASDIADKILRPSKPTLAIHNKISSLMEHVPDSLEWLLRPLRLTVESLLSLVGIVIGITSVLFDALFLVVQFVKFIFDVVGITRPSPR